VIAGQTIVHSKGFVPGYPGSVTYCVGCHDQSKQEESVCSTTSMLQLVGGSPPARSPARRAADSHGESNPEGSRSSGKSLVRIFSKESEW
jgi:hypothetical protein